MLNEPQDVACNELCPYCFESFKQVHRFLRHDCKAVRDVPKTILVQQRTAHFNTSVSRQLERLQRGGGSSKRRREHDAGLDCERTCKITKTLPGPSERTNGPGLAATARKKNAEKPTHRTERAFDESSATLGVNDRGLGRPAQTARDGQGELAAAGTVLAACNGNWPYVSDGVSENVSDGEWAFATTNMSGTASTDDWAFADINLTTGDGEWAFAPTTTRAANNGEWAFEMFRDPLVS